MKTNTNTSHKALLKATGILGFSQIAKMIVGVIGSKFIAVFLGPIGIGIVGLLNNSLNIIGSVTSFGFNTVSVREVSLASAKKDVKYFSEKIKILHNWALFIGIFGAILTIIFSKILSQWTFGTPSRYFWFLILAINFLFSSLTSYRVSLLQGLRLMKPIAISNIVNSIVTTFCTIILYYFLKFDGILPVILCSSLISLLVNWYYTKNIFIEKVSFSFKEAFEKTKPLMKLGFLLSINVIFGQLCNFIIKLFLNNNGTSPVILGYYEVSLVLILSYVGLVFNAMGIDFYPRLTEIQDNNVKVKELVNNQIELGLLLITPLIIGFYFLAPNLILVLYSNQFLPVLEILKGALFAVIIKAVIWPLAFIILAKGQNRLYFKQELVSDFLNVIVTIWFYHLMGLKGIGLAMVLNYSIYGIYVFVLLKKRFEFNLRKDTRKLLVVSILIGSIVCIMSFYLKGYNFYVFCGISILISICFSYYELNKRINLKEIFNKIKFKLFGN